MKLGGTSNRLNRLNKMKIVDKKTKVVVECDEVEIDRKNDTELYVLNKDIIEPIYEQQLYKKFNTLRVPNMNEINLRKNKKTKYEINILTLSTHNLGGQTIIVEDEQKEYVNPNRGIVTQKYDTNLEFIRNNLPKANNYGIPLFSKYNIPQHKPDICFYQEYQHQNIDLNTVNQNNLRHDIYNDELFVERQKDLAFRIGGDDIVSENNSTWERGLKRFYRCPLKLNISDNGYILNIEIFNFHGGIFSESTSLSQLKSNLKILSFIAYNKYPIIVAGDFNIDLLKEDYIIEYYDLLMSKKKNVRDYISKEINFIETLPLIRKKIHNN